MKKRIALFVSLTMAVCIAACGAKEKTKLSETSPTVHKQSKASVADERDVQGTEGTDTARSRVLSAYFSVPEDVNTEATKLATEMA